MDHPTVETLIQRLDRLERNHRRLKRAGGIMLAGLALLVLVGAGFAERRTLEAESFIVKDASGKVRAVLGTAEPSSAPGLVLYDADGNANVLLHLSADGAPGLWLYDRDRVRATMNAAGERVILQLFDKENRPRAILGVQKDGAPSVELYDQDENLRSSLR